MDEINIATLLGTGGRFKNTYELLNLRAHKVPFEIPHKISYPYIERYDFYAILIF